VTPPAEVDAVDLDQEAGVEAENRVQAQRHDKDLFRRGRQLIRWWCRP
jgi:hypothetical protein